MGSGSRLEDQRENMEIYFREFQHSARKYRDPTSPSQRGYNEVRSSFQAYVREFNTWVGMGGIPGNNPLARDPHYLRIYS